MLDAARYSAAESLRDGRRVEIRALRPEDRPDFLSAVDRVGSRSRYLRFFGFKRDFTDKERAFFLDVDFEKHVALVASVEEAGHEVIVGGGRYVIVGEGQAEIAFVVIDAYQGQGIGSILLRHLIIVGRAAGLDALVAEILPENLPMLKVFERCGLPVITKRDPDIIHVTLQLN